MPTVLSPSKSLSGSESYFFVRLVKVSNRLGVVGTCYLYLCDSVGSPACFFSRLTRKVKKRHKQNNRGHIQTPRVW